MTQQEYIDSIYRDKAKQDSNSRDLSRSLQLLAKTVFGEVNRFIFELLQNADDSPDEGQTDVNVTFKLTENYLLFSHDGKHFSKDDVLGISSVASRASEKDHDIEKTGYKGIGFKSVFGTSDEVHIISGGYSFKYDRNHDAWQDGEYPWQVIPIWNTDLPNETKDELNLSAVNTLIKVQDRDAIAKEIQAVFEDCQIILFLRHVHKVDFYNRNKLTFSIQKDVDDDGTITLYKNRGAISKWKVKNYVIPIPADLTGKLARLSDVECPEKLKTATHTKLTFSAQINESKIIQTKGSYLYCYLPTKVDKGFNFLINGDFITNAERTDLLLNIWNIFLLQQIAFKQIRWLAELHDSQFADQILKLFRSKFAFSNLSTIDKAFNESLEKAVDKIPFLPNIHNADLVKATEAIIDPYDASSMFDKNQLIEFFNTEKFIIRKELENTSAIADYTISLTFESMCKFVSKIDGPNTNPTFATNAIYFFFNNTLNGKNQSWLQKLRELAFIPDDTNGLFNPRELYFPVDDEDPIITELGGIRYINSAVLTNCRGYSDVIKWLHQLGIKDPTDIEIIRKTVFPLIETNGFNVINIIPITRFLFHVFQTGVYSDLDYTVLKRIKVLCGGTLMASSMSYLPDEMHPQQKLSNFLPQSSFISLSYIGPSEDAKLWGEFFKRIDVRDGLTITVNTAKVERGKLIASAPHSQPYFQWLDDNEYYPNLYAPWKNSGQHYLTNFTDIGFRTYLAGYDFAKQFWKQVLLSWDTFKSQCDQSLYSYYKGASNIVPSYVQFYVQTQPSIPCTDKVCRSGNEIYSPTRKALVNEVYFVADLDISMTKEQQKFFGFKTEITIVECLNILDAATKRPFSPEVQRQINSAYEEIVVSEGNPSFEQMITNWRKHGQLLAENNTFQSIGNLFSFSISGMQPPANSDRFLKIPGSMSVAEAEALCKLLQIPFITYDDLEFIPEDLQNEYSLREALLERIQFLAIVAGQKEGGDSAVIFNRLTRIIQQIEFKTASKLSLIYEHNGKTIYGSEIEAWIGRNSFIFKGNWKSPLQRYAISNQLATLLELKGFERELELFLQLSGGDITLWLQQKGYDVADIVIPEFAFDEATVDVGNQEELSFTIEAFNPEVLPAEINYQAVQATVRATSPAVSVTKPTYSSVKDESVRLDIGRWAEEFVNNYFINRADQYTEITWLNESAEQGFPYDFQVVENGLSKYIEVKGTPSNDKDVIYLSANEWQLLFEKSGNYSLFRVFGAGTKGARLERIDGPANLIASGSFIDFPIELRL